jgi:hypothetical protein
MHPAFAVALRDVLAVAVTREIDKAVMDLLVDEHGPGNIRLIRLHSGLGTFG